MRIGSDIVPPTFSVIVPTYNRPAALAECLAAMARLDYPQPALEVIVVDDGGTADLAPVVARFSHTMNLRCLRQTNAGPAAARNIGAAAAKHEFLAFTDDDCIAHPDWLQRLAAALCDNPDALVGGQTHNARPDNLCSVASQTIIDVVNIHFNHDHQHAVFFPSNNMAMSRANYLSVGGFDATFRCSEDRDLCDRWTARGWRLVFAPDAVVDHTREMNLCDFVKQHFGYGRGAWRFHRARQLRQTGKLEVDGGFYMKCFRQAWTNHPPHHAISLLALLGVWQLANTAGVFYEAMGSPLMQGSRRTAFILPLPPGEGRREGVSE